MSTLFFTFASSFMALFPVANPIGMGFILSGMLSNYDEVEQKKMMQKIVLYFIVLGVSSLIIGRFILYMFSLSLPIVQMGGGFLISKTALGWLSESQASSATTNVKNQIDDVSSQLFYPMTFPLCMGPGTMSVIFTLTAASTAKDEHIVHSIANYGVIAIAICLMAVILYLVVTKGQLLMKRLGKSGNLVINKLVAFFTFCIGAQIMFEGLNKIFDWGLKF